MPGPNVTRGYGILEGFLAKQRCKMANQLIPEGCRSGRILDIGCGSYPLLLLSTEYSEKFGLDQIIEKDLRGQAGYQGIHLAHHDIHTDDFLPFADEYFDTVTMLAVFEHIEPGRLVSVLTEIHRILKPGGMYILTTPTAWTDRLLKLMAKLRLVSPIEIEEHKDVYTHKKIAEFLQKSAFSSEKMRFGYFEAYMNIWATAVK